MNGRRKKKSWLYRHFTRYFSKKNEKKRNPDVAAAASAQKFSESDKPKFKLLFRWKKKFSKHIRKKRVIRVIDPNTLAANIALRNFNPNPDSTASAVSDQTRTKTIGNSRNVYHQRHQEISTESDSETKTVYVRRSRVITFAKIKNIVTNLDLRSMAHSLGLFILSYLFVYLFSLLSG